MSEFLWVQEMERVYAKCYQTLTTPGSMTLIVKDHMEQGNRIQLTKKAVDASIRVGFSYDPDEHFKWAAPGMPYTAARRAKGEQVVDDEDIVILRKGGELCQDKVGTTSSSTRLDYSLTGVHA